MKTFSEGMNGVRIHGVPGTLYKDIDGGPEIPQDDISKDDISKDAFGPQDVKEKDIRQGTDIKTILLAYFRAAGIVEHGHQKYIEQKVEKEWKEEGHGKKYMVDFLEFLQAADRKFILEEGIKPALTGDEEAVLALYYNAAKIVSNNRKRFIERKIKEDWPKKKPSKTDPIKYKSAFLTFIGEADKEFKGFIPKEVERVELPTEAEKEAMEKEIAELVARRVPGLTLEEKERIWKRKGVVPPWWPEKLQQKTWPYYAAKIIKHMNRSAAEVEDATKRACNGELKVDETELSKREKNVKEDLIKKLGLLGKGLSKVEILRRLKVPLKAETEKIRDIREAQRLIRAVWPMQEAKKIIAGKRTMPRDIYLRKEFAEVMKELELRAFSEGISVESFQASPIVTEAVLKKEAQVAAKSAATKLLKYFVTKEGLKISAKTAAKAIAKLSGTLMSPYLVPLIWAPEIIDIATSKDIQKVWKNMKDENWWKEAIERDKEMRAEARKGKMPRLFSTAPHGEYFHRDVGWY